MYALNILIITALLSGCGSISTVTNSDFMISSNLSKAETRCEELPRVYSGVAFDICTVHSNKVNTVDTIFYSYYLFDTIPSAIIDTIVLPYTIYQQVDSGNVSLGAK